MTTPTGRPVDPAGPTGLSARWTLRESRAVSYVAEVRAADAGRTGWTLRVEDRAATGVTDAWGMTCAVTGCVLTCTGEDWAAALAPGGSVRVGLQVQTQGTTRRAPRLTVS